MAWTGTYPENPADVVRVEVAWWQGKPVLFDIRGVWKRESSYYATATPFSRGTPALEEAVVFLVFIFTLGGAALVARHNLKLGRGDRKGAAHLATVACLGVMGDW